MKGHTNGEIEASVGVILGLDGGTTSTGCICIPMSAAIPFTDAKAVESLDILSTASVGCYNFNSIGEAAAKKTLEKVMAEALSMAHSTYSIVRAICSAVFGVNHPSDQQKILEWVTHVPLCIDCRR